MRFTKPSTDEIKKYAESIQFDLDAEKFYDHYEANGWMVGRTKMKDWKAAVRTWRHKDREFRTTKGRESESGFVPTKAPIIS